MNRRDGLSALHVARCHFIAVACCSALTGAGGCGGQDASSGNTGPSPDSSADSSTPDGSAPSTGPFADAAVFDANAADATTRDGSTLDGAFAVTTDAAHDAAVVGATAGLSAGWARAYASGDPLNGTPAVLAAYADGVVLAGASADPSVVGVTQFADASVTSEAFVGRLRHDGSSMWAAPLNGAGMPSGIAATSDGHVMVVAPWLPNQTKVSTGYVGTDIYLGKFGADGTRVFEKDISLPVDAGSNSDLGVNGIAVDSTGASYIVGQAIGSDGVNTIAFVKVDASGAFVWAKMFAGEAAGDEMIGYAAAVLPGGDVVIGGDVTGHVDFGGGARSTLFAGTYETMGYLARFTAAGQWVSDVTFGTGGASDTFTLAVTPSGNVLVGGFLAGTATFGTLTLNAPFQSDTAYVADLPPTWSGGWGSVDADGGPSSSGANPITTAVAADTLGRVHATGSFDGERLVASYLEATGEALAGFTADVGDAGSAVSGRSLAVDSTQSVWVSGLFGDYAKFGTITLDGAAPPYAGATVSPFVVRLDPVASP